MLLPLQIITPLKGVLTLGDSCKNGGMFWRSMLICRACMLANALPHPSVCSLLRVAAPRFRFRLGRGRLGPDLPDLVRHEATLLRSQRPARDLQDTRRGAGGCHARAGGCRARAGHPSLGLSATRFEAESCLERELSVRSREFDMPSGFQASNRMGTRRDAANSFHPGSALE